MRREIIAVDEHGFTDAHPAKDVSWRRASVVDVLAEVAAAAVEVAGEGDLGGSGFGPTFRVLHGPVDDPE